MRRRPLLAGALSLAVGATAAAQPAAGLRRLAIVSPAEPQATMVEGGGNPYYDVLFEALRKLGHVDGKTLAVERYGREQAAAGLPALAEAAVRSKPDLIYGIGAIPLLKEATSTIPIVALTNDPIALGITDSLARPSGNFTGVVVDTGPALYGKRIDLLREAFPALSALGYVGARPAWEAVQGPPVRAAASAAGFSLSVGLIDIPGSGDSYRHAVAALAGEGANAILVGDSPDALVNRAAIVAALAERRLPAIHTFIESVQAGGLMAYSFDLAELNRRAAQDIDAILRGTPVAAIPFYQVSKFLLAINQRTALALGLTLPPTLLARADEVLE